MIKILLVDDNLTFLTAVKKFLAMLPDAQVIAEAHDGRRALAQAAQWRPDLVLLDIMMPG
jgi:DNA-binding NarL/FixJ family response regulator